MQGALKPFGRVPQGIYSKGFQDHGYYESAHKDHDYVQNPSNVLKPKLGLVLDVSKPVLDGSKPVLDGSKLLLDTLEFMFFFRCHWFEPLLAGVIAVRANDRADFIFYAASRPFVFKPDPSPKVKAAPKDRPETLCLPS